jgi:asparagine synthase (glutamine-hydrolysing)
MTAALIHRGPDDEGYHFEPGVGLGMRRLSIIDVAGGRQPIANEDGTARIVFNGEIYNYLELRAELERSGHVLATSSDTETVLHLYEDLGPGCLERLNGMFGLAIWDSTRRRLFLARDRAGEKPLYYWADEHRIAFASELKALLLCPFVPRAIDRSAVVDYLTFMYVRAPRTPFEGIKKLPPGHHLTFDASACAVSPWWSLARHATPCELGDDALIERIATLLDDSVRLRLRSDVPVGAFLSGGLDSASVVGHAARLLGRDHPIASFSVGFPGDGIDELGYARIASDAFGTEHNELVVSLADAIEGLPRLVWHLDEPNADSAIIPTDMVSRLARTKLRVVLSGLGGDEIFGGYPRYIRRSRELYRRIPAAVRRRILLPLARTLAPRQHERLLTAELPEAREYLDAVSMFSGAEVRALTGASSEAGLEAEFAASPPGDVVNRLLHVDFQTYLPDDILAVTDRMSMAESVEARAPFLDHRLIELMAGVPGDRKVRGREWKWALKRAVAPVVPRAILRRGKWGFGAPVRSWMERDLLPVTRKLLGASAAVASGLLDRAGLEAVLARVPTPLDGRSAQKLWGLLVLEVWARVFLGGSTSPGVAPRATLREL